MDSTTLTNDVLCGMEFDVVINKKFDLSPVVSPDDEQLSGTWKCSGDIGTD